MLFKFSWYSWLNPAHGHVEYSEFQASIFAWWRALSFLGYSLKAKNLSSQLLGKFWTNMREVSVGLATFPSAGPVTKRFLKKFNAVYFVSGYETSVVDPFSDTAREAENSKAGANDPLTHWPDQGTTWKPERSQCVGLSARIEMLTYLCDGHCKCKYQVTE